MRYRSGSNRQFSITAFKFESQAPDLFASESRHYRNSRDFRWPPANSKLGAADVDKNRIITALEAFNYAERQVEDLFERSGQLATEHARMEGDRMGRFSLARLGPGPRVNDDERLNDLVGDRNVLNARIDELRLSRERMSTDEYRARLLEVMLELAKVEEAIEKREREVSLDE